MPEKAFAWVEAAGKWRPLGDAVAAATCISLTYRLPSVLLGDSHWCTVQTGRQEGAQRRALSKKVERGE